MQISKTSKECVTLASSTDAYLKKEEGKNSNRASFFPGQIPRNTDAETWADAHSMNMHFQLNLTSSEHVLAAKLRLFKLPQDSISTSSSSSISTYEEEEEDEKKIRVSVYFYTKSLKKHRGNYRINLFTRQEITRMYNTCPICNAHWIFKWPEYNIVYK